jgi:glycosyltransferase involved in cell wall biosynthesis
MSDLVPGTVILVTQLIDPDDPVLGVITAQVEALRPHCERLVVIANHVGSVPPSLASTVQSLGKERGLGRLHRGLRYQRLLMRAARGPKPVTLIAHMCPEYLNLAGPIAKAFDMRTVLWFAHPRQSGTLRRAERRADRIITSLPGAYPYRDTDVRAIGQAVDVDRFPVTAIPVTEPRTVLALGRTSPVKGYATLVQAMALARDRGADLRLAIVGPSTNEAERRHREELAGSIAALGLEDRVRLEPAVAPKDVPDLLRSCTAVMNVTAAGSGDKTVFEAMAASRPVFVLDGAFNELVADVPLTLVHSGTPESVSDCLVRIAHAAPHELETTARILRGRVESGHSLRSWTDAVAEVARELQTSRPVGSGA